RFYKSETMGRPSVAPGVYFRMLMVGYFEGIDAERGIAWRCADSLSLKSFLGFALTESTPDHSTVSRTRRLIDLETHGRVFTWMLQVLAKHGLIDGKTIGVDGTTLEANAAMRSIVRRDTGESYTEFLTKLAKASGIETPTQEDLAKLERTRAMTVMTPWLISKSSGLAATFRSRNDDNEIGSARKQNAMPYTPIGAGFEATAARAYCVVEV